MIGSGSGRQQFPPGHGATTAALNVMTHAVMTVKARRMAFTAALPNGPEKA